MDRLESKASIELPKDVHTHKVKTSANGKKNNGSCLLYMNLLVECMDSNKQRGEDYFIVSIFICLQPIIMSHLNVQITQV